MKIQKTSIPDLLLIEPQVFGDERGFFMEGWNTEKYASQGLKADFVQDNLSSSQKGVLRGLHYQNPQGQGKLVSVLNGTVFDVAVDIRANSATFGKWEGFILSEENKKQLYIPEGFAHGFLVLSEKALFFYKCTKFYAPQHETTIIWNDPSIGIEWPLNDIKPILSDKDKKGQLLANINKTKLA
jgi:dTDP-4-dehydrorhamnose 3,5-epimerase